MDQNSAAFPHKAAEVRLGGQPGIMLAALYIKPPVERLMDLELALTPSTSTISITLDGIHAGRAVWENSRIVEIEIVDVIPSTEYTMRLAIHEIELAFIRGLRDPDVLEASAPVELLPIVRATKAPPPPKKVKEKDPGKILGDLNEERALVLVSEACKTLPWVSVVRKATEDEDQAGIDIVIETSDAGDLFAQVKSSKNNARSWVNTYNGSAIFPRTMMIIFQGEHHSTKVDYLVAKLNGIHDEALLAPGAATFRATKRLTRLAEERLAAVAAAPSPLVPHVTWLETAELEEKKRVDVLWDSRPVT